MFRFESPQYLYFLLLIPLLVGLYFLHRALRKKRIRRLGEPALIQDLMPNVSVRRPLVKFILMLTAYALLCIMVARPQMGMRLKTTERHGIEIMVALDVSNSMLAGDVAPSRLEKAKQIMSNITDKLQDDRIGLVVFAGDAFIQMPITNDFVSARMFLDAINTNMVSIQGTNIGEAINLCQGCFSSKNDVGRAIVLITDGEDHEGEALEAAQAAANAGTRLFILGIGTEKGATIPWQGHSLRDNEGNIVISRLSVDMCKQVAQAGKGQFIQVDNSTVAQDRLYYELDQLQHADLGEASYEEYDEQFLIFALLAMLLLIVEIVIMERQNPLLNRIKLFKK